MISEYRILRSKRKTISLCVRPDGSLEVRAPLHFSSQRIDQFVQSKSIWIQRAQSKYQNAIHLQVPETIGIEVLRVFTEKKANDFIHGFPGKKPVSVKVRKRKSVWGTCNSKGVLSINLMAGLLPDPLFEYILIHELIHLEVMNHTVYFWNLVSYYLPDWKERREELKRYKLS